MVHLIRFEGNIFGTKGMLFLPNGWNCCTMEPPWLDNIKSRSCIPEGEYLAGLKLSPKYGDVYQVFDVPDRTGILFHSGNYAGDEESGLKSDTDGCILLGKNHGELLGQDVVLSSKVTMSEFMLETKGLPLKLTIKGEAQLDR